MRSRKRGGLAGGNRVRRIAGSYVPRADVCLRARVEAVLKRTRAREYCSNSLEEIGLWERICNYVRNFATVYQEKYN